VVELGVGGGVRGVGGGGIGRGVGKGREKGRGKGRERDMRGLELTVEIWERMSCRRKKNMGRARKWR